MEKNSHHLIRCLNCGTKNRIVHENISGVPKCGKCKAELKMDQAERNGGESFFFRCATCRTRNRIPSWKINAEAKCGKCGTVLDTKELFTAHPLMILETNFDQLVLGSPLPVLLFAWAPWCPTCRTAMPVIDDFAKDAKGKVRVGKINVDSSPGISTKFNILSVPQILIFDNGRLQETMPGALQKHEIMMKMARYI
ncbi:MAG: thiol reductase thioredoxin [Deltaproteobacteria bacterium]|jgi:thioredoxin 2|nr:thiol reductase thioredoxin [Deltaproteobacteria bacterium]